MLPAGFETAVSTGGRPQKPLGPAVCHKYELIFGLLTLITKY